MTLSPAVHACSGDDGPCGSLARLCAAEPEWRVGMRVDDAALVDFDGDGWEDATVALRRDGQQLALAQAGGWRSLLFFTEKPVALAAVRGEVAVAMTTPPALAFFGVDASGRLERRRDIALDTEPTALRSSDLDGDGERELIATLADVNQGGAGAVVVIDPRSGTMQRRAAGSSPLDLDIGDVDGDGRLDVVAIDPAADALQVLRGAGGGTLHPARAHLAKAKMAWLDLADHDGDGDLDALTRNFESSVMVHRNNGAGEFSSPVALPFSGVKPEGSGLVAGPIASGGLAGVTVPQGPVVATWFGKGAVWLGHVETALRGAGTWVGAGTEDDFLVGGDGFLSRFAYQRGPAPVEVWRGAGPENRSGPEALATGDVDGDHLLDFVVAASGKLHVFRGRADLGFDGSAVLDLFAPASVLVVRDVTGDGRADVVAGEETIVRVAIGTAEGDLVWGASVEPAVPPRELVPLSTGVDQPAAITVVSADVYGAAESSGLPVLRFSANGDSVEESVVAGSLFVDRVVAVDFDEDGVDEPLILATRDDIAVLTRMTPSGTSYDPGPEHDLVALSGLMLTEESGRRLAVADIDGDGAPEVMLRFSGSSLRVSGLVDDAPVVAPDVPTPNHLRDLDRDGLVDAAYLYSDTLMFRRGLADGTFEEEARSHPFAGARLLAFAARIGAQFDIVQFSDEVVASHLVREIVRPGVEDYFVHFHGPAYDFRTGDVDADGHDDVVTFGFGAGTTWLWGSDTVPLTRGDGVNKYHSGRALGDLDGDGTLEVVAVDISNQFVAYLLPQREERALEVSRLDDGSVLRLEVADVDADERADLLVVYFAYSSEGTELALAVAHGTGPYRFGPWARLATIPSAESVELAVGDVDADADLDALLSPSTGPAALVRATGPRAWAEAEMVSGVAAEPGVATPPRAMFSRPDARGRVELVTHDGATIYHHTEGHADQRTPLVHDEALADSTLLRVADADGDGRPDLVVTDAERTHVWLRGEGGFRRVTLADVPLEAAEFADIDGDGRPDLIGLSGGGVFVRRSGG